MNWDNVASNAWVIGIGGSLVAAGIVWLGRRLYWRKQKSRKGAIEGVQGNTVQQNANVSPVMTQNFQPTINIHPTVAAATKDNLSERHTPQTETGTEHELWKRIVALQNAFWALPKKGGELRGRPPGARESAEFVKRYEDSKRLLEEERPFIPKAIADDADTLLSLAFDEVIRATRYPDPFNNGNLSTLLNEKFLDQRSDNMRKFDAGAKKLQNTMRASREGEAG
jgi:hypothetical protein